MPRDDNAFLAAFVVDFGSMQGPANVRLLLQQDRASARLLEGRVTLRWLRRFALVSCIAGLAPSASSAQGFKVVVNSANPVASLSRTSAADAFLGRTREWSHGGALRPVDVTASTSVRQAFSERILLKPTSAIKSFWQQQIFSGRGVPPPEMRSEREVIDFVRTNPGAVGYVSSETDTTGVKVIEIVYGREG